MERNIRILAFSYLELADAAIAKKQDHDVAAYKAHYEEIQDVYTYLLAALRGLDTLRFKTNSENYDLLYQYLREPGGTHRRADPDRLAGECLPALADTGTADHNSRNWS